MEITEESFIQAQQKMEELRQRGHALSAHYDPTKNRIVIGLNTGVEISFPPDRVPGLGDATAEELAAIEISPSGLGLHWPRRDVDLFLPAVLQGEFGSRTALIHG